ncbi:MAG: hypothetical protein ACM3PV_15020 [Betaproteobacteria bacterium]
MADVQKGYETSDAHAGATFRAGLYILGTMFLVAAVVVPLYWLYARRETAAQPRPASLVREQAPAAAPTFPKLVSSEPPVLAEFRRQEDELLTSYGWVEKDRGVARMPIAEAMRLVGDRGRLPTLPAPSPAPQSSAGAAR